MSRTEKIRIKILKLLEKRNLTGNEIVEELSKEDKDVVKGILREEYENNRINILNPSNNFEIDEIYTRHLKLTEKGKRILLDHPKWYDDFLGRKQIIPILIALFSVVIIYLQLNAQIISITPNRPVLDIYAADWMGDPPELSAQYLAKENYSGEKTRLYIKNSGGIDTQHVTIRLISDVFSSGIDNIDNIPAGKTGTAVLFIRQTSCIYEECDESILPRGIYPMEFKITCLNCESEDRESIKTIDFCIWHGTNNECETGLYD